MTASSSPRPRAKAGARASRRPAPAGSSMAAARVKAGWWAAGGPTAANPPRAWRATVDGLRLRPVNPKLCLVVSCAALVVSGCGSDSSTVTVEPHPTIIELAPRDFLGSLKCGTEEGNLQRYVATLTDVTRVHEEGAGGGPGEP